MRDVITEIPGSVIVELCEKLGVDHRSVHRIEIDPRRVMVIHEYRRSPGGVTLSDPPRDPLQRITDVAIRWGKSDA